MRSLQRDPLYLEFVHFYMIIYVHLYLSIYTKKRGKKFGRPRKEVEDWDNVYYQWSQKKITAQKAASILKISRTQFYKLVQEEREGGVLRRDDGE